MRAGRAIGVDIGGTKIAVGAVDGIGSILTRAEAPTRPQAGFEAGLGVIATAVDSVLREAGWSAAEVDGIGIGCPGPLDPARGTIENDYTLPGWGGHNVVEPLRERYGRPVWLENDGDAAVMGEAFAGAARGCTEVVMLTFGTGIGAGILAGGDVYRGLLGQHPELGHIPVEPGGPQCYCGGRGCFESFASGTAIGAAGSGSARDVFAARARGDAAATAVIDGAIRASAVAAWTIVHTFLPERIVLGGGLMEDHFDLFADAMARAIAGATQVPPGVTVVRAERGAAAGIVGAARIAVVRGRAASD